MSKRGLIRLGFVVVLLCGIFAASGCLSKEQIEQGQTAVEQVIDDADGVIERLETEIAALPDSDPAKPGLVAKLERVKKVRADAEDAVRKGNAVLASLETGEITQETRDALSLIPYGSYLLLGLSVFGHLKQRGVIDRYKTHATNIIKSWQAVGTELTSDEKAAAATIQGKETTAFVHEIKANL